MFKILYLPTGEYVRTSCKSKLKNEFSSKEEATKYITDIFLGITNKHDIFISEIADFRRSNPAAKKRNKAVPEYLLEVVEV